MMIKNCILCFAVLFLVSCGGADQETSTSSQAQGHSHEAGESQDDSGHGHSHAPAETQDDDGHGHSHESGEASDDDGHAAASGGTDAGHDDHEEAELRVSRQKQEEWGIVVEAPRIQNTSSRVTLPGTMALNQNRTAHLTSFIHGQIMSVSADLGDRVRKGQNLLTINSPDFGKAQADFLNTRARLNLSRIENERAKVLFEKSALGEKEYLRRKAEYEKLSTEYGAQESNLHSYGMTHEQIQALIDRSGAIEEKEFKCEMVDPGLPLYAPIPGTVIFRDAVMGEHIEPEKILFTVSDLHTLWAVLDAYEKDMPYINKKSKVHITSQLYPDEQFSGTITYISDIIDQQLRTIKIRVEVENPGHLLKPNMYIQGFVENRAGEKDILAVPENALLNLDGQKIVFIAAGEDLFIPRPVSTGRKDGDLVIITDGLGRDERLVTKGAFTLKTELTKRTFGNVHVH